MRKSFFKGCNKILIVSSLLLISFTALPNAHIQAYADQGYILLAHMEYHSVSVGDNVSIGSRLGKMGRTGYATTHHVHVEYTPTAANAKGDRLNPKNYVNILNTLDKPAKIICDWGCYSGHTGIDLKPRDESNDAFVVSPVNGVVTERGYDGDGWGNYVRIRITSSDPKPPVDDRSKGPFALAGDFNGDGNDESAFIRGINYNGIEILIGNSGSNTEQVANYTPWISIESGFPLERVDDRFVVGDFNGDGKDDIAVLFDSTDYSTNNTGSTGIHVFLSNGSGFDYKKNWHVFDSGFPVSRIKERIVAGDFDGDGKDDIAVMYDATVPGTGSTGTSRIYVFKSDGSKFTHSLWHSFDTGFPLDRVAGRMVAGDFNGDGKDDVAVFYDATVPGTGSTGTANIFTFMSTGSKFDHHKAFTYDTGFPLSNVANRVASGDFNGDGKDDIVAIYDHTSGISGSTGAMKAYVFLSSGTGKEFTAQKWEEITAGYPLSSVGNRVSVGDFNGDGNADVALMFYNGQNYIRHLLNSNGKEFNYSGSQ